MLATDNDTTEGFEITVDESGDGSIVSLKGRLTIDSSPGLRDLLLPMLRVPAAKAVTVDFAGVTHMDVSGIATLLEALKIARSRGATLCLTGLHGRLLHLFEVAGVLPLFESNGRSGTSSPEMKVS